MTMNMQKSSPRPGSFVLLFECPICGSLLLETAKDLHAEWHIQRGEADESEDILYADVATIPDEFLQ